MVHRAAWAAPGRVPGLDPPGGHSGDHVGIFREALRCRTTSNGRGCACGITVCAVRLDPHPLPMPGKTGRKTGYSAGKGFWQLAEDPETLTKKKACNSLSINPME